MATQSAAILITRPKAEGDAFAAALTARFGTRVRPVVSPLLAPHNLTPDLPVGDYSAVAFTSAQAVDAALPFLPRLPKLAWCVGDRTARAAASAGFDARSAGGDGEALVRAMAREGSEGSILYLRGVDTSYNLLEKLRELGMHADETIVYLQAPQDFQPEASDLLRRHDDVIVPLFSPRSARLFHAALPGETLAPLHIAAMSAKVADALEDMPRANLTIAHHPDASAMLDAVETLLVQLPPP